MVDRTPPPPPPVSLRPLATSSVAPRHRMLLHFFTQFLSFFKYFFSYYAHSTIRYSYCSWLSPSCIVPFYQSCEKVNSTQQTISPPPLTIIPPPYSLSARLLLIRPGASLQGIAFLSSVFVLFFSQIIFDFSCYVHSIIPYPYCSQLSRHVSCHFWQWDQQSWP